MLDFESFISACGFEPPRDLQPGKIARFSTNGKRGDDSGWALLFNDGEGGVIGDWRTGEQQIWQSEKVQTFDPEQKLNWQRAIESARKQAEEEKRQGYAEAAERAEKIWALECTAQMIAMHPYLARKGITHHGVRIFSGTLTIREMNCQGALVIPVRNVEGKLTTLEFISADGEKRFLPRGEIPGGFFLLGNIKPTLLIAEGFSTGASIHEATGMPVVVAFNAGNLMRVAKALRLKYPHVRLVFCADNDVGVEGGGVKNPGVAKAQKAADEVGGVVVIPEMNGEKCDFNDVAVKLGKDKVKLAIEPHTMTTASTDDLALLRHMIEQEGRTLRNPSAYRDEVRDRLLGRFKVLGATLPWATTKQNVIFQDKQVSVWAGINGHGKSALLNQVLMEFVLQQHKVWLASLEMPVGATLERMVRQAAGVKVPNDEYIDAFHTWIEKKIFLHDHIGRESTRKMAAMIKYVHEKTGCKHYVIDSMMRVVRSPDDYAGQKEFIELMCSTAHDLGVHIHVVAHMRKGESEMEQSGKFDVKGASEITDLVDNLFVVWRNKQKEKMLGSLFNTDDRGRWIVLPDTVVAVAKQRHGDWEGEIGLWYHADSKSYHENSERNTWSISMEQMGIEVKDHVAF